MSQIEATVLQCYLQTNKITTELKELKGNKIDEMMAKVNAIATKKAGFENDKGFTDLATAILTGLVQIITIFNSKKETKEMMQAVSSIIPYINSTLKQLAFQDLKSDAEQTLIINSMLPMATESKRNLSEPSKEIRQMLIEIIQMQISITRTIATG
ncbi:MAG: hypothetical protein L0207_06070 [Chlamydiae bacterium]|nr:hypothetical protein [Chlamydiota bacterium]